MYKVFSRGPTEGLTTVQKLGQILRCFSEFKYNSYYHVLITMIVLLLSMNILYNCIISLDSVYVFKIHFYGCIIFDFLSDMDK